MPHADEEDFKPWSSRKSGLVAGAIVGGAVILLTVVTVFDLWIYFGFAMAGLLVLLVILIIFGIIWEGLDSTFGENRKERNLGDYY